MTFRKLCFDLIRESATSLKRGGGASPPNGSQRFLCHPLSVFEFDLRVVSLAVLFSVAMMRRLSMSSPRSVPEGISGRISRRVVGTMAARRLLRVLQSSVIDGL
jgi:hypothetical protein